MTKPYDFSSSPHEAPSEGGRRRAKFRSAERRIRDRHSTWQQIEVAGPRSTEIAELLDLSSSGAMFRLAACSIVRVRDKVVLTLGDGTQLDGSVVWTRQGIAGMRFNVHLLDAEDFLSFEHLGYGWYSALVRMQRKRHGLTDG